MWILVEPEDACIDMYAVEADNNFGTTSVHECGRKCGKTATHFAYGTNDLGGEGCRDGICKCHCIEKCHQLKHQDYWFFKYKSRYNFRENGKEI